MVTSKSTCKSLTTVIGGDKDEEADAVALRFLLIVATLMADSCLSMCNAYNLNSIRMRCNGMCVV